MRVKKRKEGDYEKPQKFLISDGSQKLQKEFLMCWKYLKESSIYFAVIIALFLVSFLIGFLFPVFFQELIRRFIQEIVEKTKDMNFFQLFVFIFKNNLTTAFFGLILGIVLGLFPLLLAIFNGYVLGFVSVKTTSIYGFPVLFRLLPHGIFEMPALILSLGLGLKLGMFVFSRDKKYLAYNLENSLRTFLFVILPLLLIAGLIETSLVFLLG